MKGVVASALFASLFSISSAFAATTVCQFPSEVLGSGTFNCAIPQQASVSSVRIGFLGIYQRLQSVVNCAQGNGTFVASNTQLFRVIDQASSADLAIEGINLGHAGMTINGTDTSVATRNSRRVADVDAGFNSLFQGTGTRTLRITTQGSQALSQLGCPGGMSLDNYAGGSIVVEVNP